MINELYKEVQKLCTKTVDIEEIRKLMSTSNHNLVYVLEDSVGIKREYMLELLTDDKVYLNVYEPIKGYRGKHTTTYTIELFKKELSCVYFVE